MRVTTQISLIAASLALVIGMLVFIQTALSVQADLQTWLRQQQAMQTDLHAIRLDMANVDDFLEAIEERLAQGQTIQRAGWERLGNAGESALPPLETVATELETLANATESLVVTLEAVETSLETPPPAAGPQPAPRFYYPRQQP